jgi:archaellum biogenesis ATPase FlaH
MIDPIEFESILVKLLFQNTEVRDKVVPILRVDLFDDFDCKELVKHILYFENKFQKFPTVSDLKLKLTDREVFDSLTEILNKDVSEYSQEVLKIEIENFFKKKLLYSFITDIATGLKEEDLSKLKNTPEQLREAMAFTLDDRVGLDFFEDGERLWTYFNTDDFTVSSGLKVLDYWLDGGFHEKSLSLILCQVNGGKTAIKTAIASNCIMNNKKVLYVTLEMAEEKISERVMFNVFNLNRAELRKLNKEQFLDKFNQSKKTFNTKFIIREFPTKSANTNYIRNLLKELRVKKKFIPDIIFVDYLAILCPNAMGKSDNSYSEQKRIAQELRALSMEMSIPVISSIQVNRDGFGKLDIDMDDISDSIGVAFDSDVVIAATQNDDLRTNGKYMFNIVKNRYGLNKIKFPVNIDFYKMRIWDDDVELEKLKNPNVKQPVTSQQKVDEGVSLIKDVIKKDSPIIFK